MFAQRILRSSVLLAGACLGLGMAPAHAQDAIFNDSLELPFNFPTDAQAARFLNRATFGATASDIQAVRAQSLAGWLDAQLDNPTATLARPWLEAYAASLPAGSTITQDDRLHRWFDVAVNAPDQVRQRVAWALGQIIITSDRDAFLVDREVQMAEWNDLLVRNALGNYRTLMQEATFSPMMGRYLTTLRNRKFELVRSSTTPPTFTAGNNGVQPDENYAREVMQLFSIGLLVRGGDFYITYPDELNPNPGALRTTYGEDDIAGLARIYTGLSYGCTQGASVVGGVTLNRNCGTNDQTACTGIACRFTAAGRLFSNNPPEDIVMTSRGLEHPDWYRPMVCYPRYNDNGRESNNNSSNPLETDVDTFNLPPGTPAPDKVLVLGTSGANATLTIGPSFLNSVPLNCHQIAVNNGLPDNATSLSPAEQQACIDYCEGNVNASLDLLFNHPNTPPMVARQLIQRLVTSNPTSGYVQRVAAAFINNGSGVRGDLKAVVRAILLDDEARRPFDDPATSVNFGKVREPLLKQVALWRHFGALSPNTAVIPATNPQGGEANPLAGQAGVRRWGNRAPQDFFEQRPLGAPSVFNFYEPDYRQPGQVAQAGLFSPELQIIHEVSAIAAANELFARICNGYGGNCSNGVLAVPSATDVNSRAYFPQAAVDAIPAVVAVNAGGAPPTVAEDMALINFFNIRMMGGTMGGADLAAIDCASPQPGMKWRLMSVLRCPRVPAPGETGDFDSLNTELNGGAGGTTGGDRAARQRRKALYLMHLVAISPEYSTQR